MEQSLSGWAFNVRTPDAGWLTRAVRAFTVEKDRGRAIRSALVMVLIRVFLSILECGRKLLENNLRMDPAK
jgi:hypothetical protein